MQDTVLSFSGISEWLWEIQKHC